MLSQQSWKDTEHGEGRWGSSGFHPLSLRRGHSMCLGRNKVPGLVGDSEGPPIILAVASLWKPSHPPQRCQTIEALSLQSNLKMKRKNQK